MDHWMVEPHPENGTYKVVNTDTGVHLRKCFFAEDSAQLYAQLKNLQPPQ